MSLSQNYLIFHLCFLLILLTAANTSSYSHLGSLKENSFPTPSFIKLVSPTPTTEEEVTTLDRFYRVYEDGTIEFKYVLSNGLAQYQRITNKVVNGETIQVYEGYYAERLPDKSYRVTHYIADENGYRRTRREFDTKPIPLPVYIPYVPKI